MHYLLTEYIIMSMSKIKNNFLTVVCVLTKYFVSTDINTLPLEGKWSIPNKYNVYLNEHTQVQCF